MYTVIIYMYTTYNIVLNIHSLVDHMTSVEQPEASFVVTGSGHWIPSSLLALSRRGPLMCL